MKRKNKKKIIDFFISPIMVLVYFLLLVTGIYSSSNRRKQERLENMEYSNAMITGFLNDGKGQAGSIVYNYEIMGIAYQESRGSMNIFSNKEIAKQFEGKYFPIVYDSLNPKNSTLLLIPSDFAAYNLIFPDSLKWVLPYFEK